tara:strand:- start:838 stop:1002 length:165 start_codon:yes stop_codon:yes gene_type:complete
MKRKNKKKKNSYDYSAEDYQEITRKDGMKKNKRRSNRHHQKQDLKYFKDNKDNN